jgi:hypothetical protein
MSNPHWVARITSLIRKYDPKTEDASFRNAYKDAVSVAQQRGQIADTRFEALMLLRDRIERWAAAISDGDALNDWLRYYGQWGRELPESILEASATRLPKRGRTVDAWRALVAGNYPKGVFEILLRSKVLKPNDATTVAAADPAEFYKSNALDAIVENGYCPPAILPLLERHEARESGQLEWSVIVASYICAHRSPKLTQPLLRSLEPGTDETRDVLRLVIKDRDAAIRLARVLAPDLRGQNRQPAREQDGDIIADVLEICCESIKRSTPVACTASLMLMELRHAFAIVEAAKPARTVPRSVSSASAHVVEWVLRNREAGRPPAACVHVTASAAELYGGVQAYIRSLSGTHSAQPEVGRAEQLARYRGRREVIEHVLSALDVNDERLLREAIEAALHNAGVHPLGKEGESASFDPARHQAAVGVVPGDPVLVNTPGRVLGQGNAELVLTKATVIPLKA